MSNMDIWIQNIDIDNLIKIIKQKEEKKMDDAIMNKQIEIVGKQSIIENRNAINIKKTEDIEKKRNEKINSLLINYRTLYKKMLKLMELYNKTINKYDKEITQIKYKKMIPRYNIIVSRLNNYGITDMKPIGTKPRHSPSTKNHKLKEIHFDSLLRDDDEEYNLITICKTRRHNHKIQKEHLEMFILSRIEKNEFELSKSDNKKYKYNNEYIKHLVVIENDEIKIKCNMLCSQMNNNTDKKCSKLISLPKLLDILDEKTRKNICVQIYKQNIKKQLIEDKNSVIYCKNNTCFYSNGYILDDIYSKEFICPECNLSMCATCHISPYHKGILCKGKVDDDIDEATKKYLFENTRQCPWCGMRAIKVSGCDRMPCKSCNKNFCWRCLMKLDDIDPYLHRDKCDKLLEGVIDHNYR